ncbi:ATP-binding protein [Ideonella margarita]|uniref:histidine kinase n=1 Tax=Ideonella margarita TaxID=2984191 RepID=A0ABU9C7A5_9BURK
MPSRKRCRVVETALSRWWPRTLFGRLLLLLLTFVFLSHWLVLTLIFGQNPAQPPPPPPVPGLAILQTHPPLWQLGSDLLLRLSALVLAAWIAARWLSRPMQRLADTAESLAQALPDLHIGSPRMALPVEGPRECREAARALNGLLARIHQQLDERDRFIASVSHDLRTPLTRLRLRAEATDLETQRVGLCRDVEDMNDTLTVTLDYLLGDSAAEAFTAVPVCVLVQGVVERWRQQGRGVTLHLHADAVLADHAAPLPVRRLALQRCIDNLVGNALRYAGDAHLELQLVEGALRLTVRDHGPGMPEAALTLALQPYYRVEGSRNRHSGGHGLGLAIAADIARQHGGQLQLANAPGGGLVAQIDLPRPPL